MSRPAASPVASMRRIIFSIADPWATSKGCRTSFRREGFSVPHGFSNLSAGGGVGSRTLVAGQWRMVLGSAHVMRCAVRSSPRWRGRQPPSIDVTCPGPPSIPGGPTKLSGNMSFVIYPLTAGEPRDQERRGGAEGLLLFPDGPQERRSLQILRPASRPADTAEVIEGRDRHPQRRVDELPRGVAHADVVAVAGRGRGRQAQEAGIGLDLGLRPFDGSRRRTEVPERGREPLHVLFRSRVADLDGPPDREGSTVRDLGKVADEDESDPEEPQPAQDESPAGSPVLGGAPQCLPSSPRHVAGEPIANGFPVLIPNGSAGVHDELVAGGVENGDEGRGPGTDRS